LDKEKTLSALKSLWKYNFTPDVGPYLKDKVKWRPYALPGEGGLIMNTNPKSEANAYGENVTWQIGYFHECMSGFEHQVAAHMMAEGMTDEALVITRTIHDRYHAAKRNPFNEIECSDHYARSMASYGTFISACGFEYHGPKGYIKFSPKITPEDFKAPFTTAEGWGTYEQHQTTETMRAQYHVKYGRLALQSIGLQTSIKVKGVNVQVGTKNIHCNFVQEGNDVQVGLSAGTHVLQNQKIVVKIS
jgi:non-lysosomal glucosylceramidase